jgi:hypothetical protein
MEYETKFGSPGGYEKGGVPLINGSAKHYACSNYFEVASTSKPYEKVIFGINQIYAGRTARLRLSMPSSKARPRSTPCPSDPLPMGVGFDPSHRLGNLQPGKVEPLVLGAWHAKYR